MRTKAAGVRTKAAGVRTKAEGARTKGEGARGGEKREDKGGTPGAGDEADVEAGAAGS
ncbi:hypothetical protein QDW14_08120 [Corynebacterium bovis]|uniref:hypothetical protein n=1 Tax=Corynebacterium bovis TaxID=36808 RepID=UPI0024480E06|nr:hypothetical protein [Corynebacterium bovis]MDH2456436.1 hypothetical protein [Corynebacterium bovis]